LKQTIFLNEDWLILQDVHDTGERMGMYREAFDQYNHIPNQLSEWEPLESLRHLQLLLADQPYFGRELRYFNQAPWWYRRTIQLEKVPGRARLTFTNADYYCRVWLNGVFLGEHEGYSDPFTYDVSSVLRAGENLLMVKVWSPWDTEVDGDCIDRRTFLVQRNMVKGTYEHSDTFVQRDVNPVGLYGNVILTLGDDACFEREPDIRYTVEADTNDILLDAACAFACIPADGGDLTLRIQCKDAQTGEIKLSKQLPLPPGAEELTVQERMGGLRLWNTWDRGGPWLYDVTVSLCREDEILDQYSRPYGFRRIAMIRTTEKTQFMLNGKPFYVRGTSYFPDAYISNMCPERYERDLAAMRRLGFNALRVHVHVELPEFYALCDRYGIGVIQDSEYNWMHPVSDAFCAQFIEVFLNNVRWLKRYASIFAWICMNEPGLQDPAGPLLGRAMTVNPGPELYRRVCLEDPDRPAIKGSFCTEDLTSGDSHNYLGALTNNTLYTQIDGTTEKLNTEFGFDAIPCEHSLRKCPPLYRRLRPLMPRVKKIQKYQYQLLKYYIEHYRAQKYQPNAGYMQFLFCDMCPQSFYGVYDWWGLPKAGVQALEESNQPLAVFLHYGPQGIYGICAVNDTDHEYKNVTIRLLMHQRGNESVYTFRGDLGADGALRFAADELQFDRENPIDIDLVMENDGRILALNHYQDVLSFPAPPPGYPSRISHELGVRLYDV